MFAGRDCALSLARNSLEYDMPAPDGESIGGLTPEERCALEVKESPLFPPSFPANLDQF